MEHLRERGWDVWAEKDDHADVRARRGTEHLIAEVKGRTSSAGTDLDTCYGQLLRRMDRSGVDDDADVRYAIVVPESLVRAAQRVPAGVRDLLDIDIWTVSDSEGVQQLQA